VAQKIQKTGLHNGVT